MIEQKKPTVNIMIDLETLGTDIDAKVIEIGAIVFDLKTGKTLDFEKDFQNELLDLQEGLSIGDIVSENDYDELYDKLIKHNYFPHKSNLNLSKLDNISLSTGTLMFWQRPENIDMFRKYFQDNDSEDTFDSEKEMWEDFDRWIESVMEEAKEQNPDSEVVIWGNGIMFDIGKMQYNFKKHGIKDRFNYYSHRDCRTVVDWASDKLGVDDTHFKDFENPETKTHDALDDCRFQAHYVSKAYNLLVNKD